MARVHTIAICPQVEISPASSTIKDASRGDFTKEYDIIYSICRKLSGKNPIVIDRRASRYSVLKVLTHYFYANGHSAYYGKEMNLPTVRENDWVFIFISSHGAVRYFDKYRDYLFQSNKSRRGDFNNLDSFYATTIDTTTGSRYMVDRRYDPWVLDEYKIEKSEIYPYKKSFPYYTVVECPTRHYITLYDYVSLDKSTVAEVGKRWFTPLHRYILHKAKDEYYYLDSVREYPSGRVIAFRTRVSEEDENRFHTLPPPDLTARRSEIVRHPDNASILDSGDFRSLLEFSKTNVVLVCAACNSGDFAYSQTSEKKFLCLAACPTNKLTYATPGIVTPGPHPLILAFESYLNKEIYRPTFLGLVMEMRETMSRNGMDMDVDLISSSFLFQGNALEERLPISF